MSFRVGSAAAVLLAAIACGTTLPLADLPPEVDAGDPPDAAPPDGPSCPATWTTRMDTVRPLAIALAPTGQLFAAGSDGALAWVAELDPCTGALLHEHRFTTTNPPDGGAAVASSLLATESELFVGGRVGVDLAQQGMVARLDKDLTSADAGVFASIGLTDLSRIARGSDGAIWLAGGLGLFAGPDAQHGWVIRVGDGGCSTQVGQYVSGLAPLDDGQVVIAIQTDAGTTALARLQGCKGNAMRAIELPEIGGPSDLQRDGDELFLSGAMGGEQNQAKGYLGVGTFDGGFRFAEPIDPTVGLDAMGRLITDGDALFVVGHRNLTFGAGTPTLYRFDRPLNEGAAPVWESQPFGGPLLLVSDIATAPRGDDALYLVGNDSGRRGGAITRCSKRSGCSR